MITKFDLEEAIAQCQGVVNPNANTCIKLASFLTVYDHMYGNKTEETDDIHQQSYSFSNGSVIDINSRSEFANEINGKSTESVLKVVDELMETLQILNPRLYNSVIKKIREVD